MITLVAVKTDKGKSCEKCKLCAYFKKSGKTAMWMKRNKNMVKIYKTLTKRFKKRYLFTKNSASIRKKPCSQQAEDVLESLERCEKTVSSICKNSEFRKVYKKAKNCMKQINCNWIPKYCNLEKDFIRIKAKRKECLDETKDESYTACMQIVTDEVPTILDYCERHDY